MYKSKIKIIIKKTFVASINDFLDLCFNLFFGHGNLLSFQNPFKVIPYHDFSFPSNKRFASEHFIIISFLDKFHPGFVKSI